MDEKDLNYLIKKYLANQCTAEEKEQLEQWYQAFEDGQKEFYNNNTEEINASSLRSIQAIKSKLSTHKEVGSSFAQSRVITHYLRYPWVVAASITLFIAMVLGLHFNVWQNSEEDTFYTAATGEVKELVLPDGTSVWLNAGSSLKFSSNFNENRRAVDLEGQAFFDVSHNPDKPFTINSGKLRTLVLGTAFSVSAYPEAILNTVTVIRGKVRVNNKESKLGYLLPDQRLEFRSDTEKSTIVEINAAKDMAWKDQELVFTHLPMQDISNYLQKWFGYQFIFKNQELKNIRFTASFKKTISLPELLEIMGEVSEVKYQLNEETKTVTFL